MTGGTRRHPRSDRAAVSVQSLWTARRWWLLHLVDRDAVELACGAQALLARIRSLGKRTTTKRDGMNERTLEGAFTLKCECEIVLDILRCELNKETDANVRSRAV